MATYRANGIVLRRTNLGETDRIVTLYTREHGKLSAVAKGARRPISRLAASTELFTYARYLLATGRNLDVVTQAETRESFPSIRDDIGAIAYATYLIELVGEMSEDRAPHPDLFDTLLSSLYMIESGIDPEIVTRAFELQFMTVSGYKPHLESCGRCGASLPAEQVSFSPSFGGALCEECGPLPEDAIMVRRQTLDAMISLLTAEPTQIRDMVIPEEMRTEMANVMRWHIRYRLERELKSAGFIQALKARAC